VIEIAFPHRIRVKTEKDALRYINLYNGKKNLYKSLYRVTNNGYLIDKIFFDFDGEKSHYATKKFTKFLHNDNIAFKVHFSGRGFHIFIPVIIKEKITDYKLSIRELQKAILDTYNLLKYCDPHVIGDIARVVRIPNTFNLRANRYCIPLRYNDIIDLSYEEIRELAVKQRWIIDYAVKGKKLELKNVKKKEHKEYDNHVIIVEGVEPCINRILEKRNPTHDERFLLVLHYKELGENMNQIVERFKKLNWSDWNERITRYQVQHIFEKGFVLPTHEWRKEKGICVGKCFVFDMENEIEKILNGEIKL